ncbi:MAG: hypothetical protein M1819_001023 [Sarea resinae]|nr:MAG: hypothetical protein M1819_001023 [Sarea resinae]
MSDFDRASTASTICIPLPSPRGEAYYVTYDLYAPPFRNLQSGTLAGNCHRIEILLAQSTHRDSIFASFNLLHGHASSNTSASSYTNEGINGGLKTPSPTYAPHALGSQAQNLPAQSDQQSGQGYAYSDSYASMNQPQPYMDVHQSHMSGGQSQGPSSATAGGMSHYAQYQQPPLLQPGPGNYSPANSYGQYAYANGVTSPQAGGHPSSASMGGQVPAQLLPLPAMTTAGQPPPGPSGLPNGQGYPQQTFDTTGQVAPPGMKPRVTATLWEDEGSLCFQVEAKGVCVARREDNHMINGTKLLNVAGMTRGRRDGILKSEKTRHVVKIGPMHLKGVWIPFERALDFANKEKITELLYPLFVHNIGALLYHPSNQTRTNAVMAAAERRRYEQNQQQQQQAQIRSSQGSQPPSLHHHHSMANSIGSHLGQSPHSIAPHPGAGRPGLDRAHTFPTPPTSASSIMNIGQTNSYEWSGQPIPSAQNAQPLSIDTGLSNTRSMPTTPATTPPGNSMQSIQQYQSGQGYDNSRPMYSAPPSQQSQYAPQPSIAQQNMARFGQPGQSSHYLKNDMGPPSSRAPGTEYDHPAKGPDGSMTHGQGNEQVGHGAGEEEAEHEHDNEYSHENAAAYGANRGPYNYNPGPAVGNLQGEHPHLSPEMTGSPSHQNQTGRVTPRASTTGQPHWAAGYSTPPRPQLPSSSSLYNVMSGDTRGSATNGNAGGEGYSSTPGISAAIQTGYPSQPHQPSTNGSASSSKRMRDVDDDDQDRYSRPTSRGAGGEIDVDGLKRRKTIREGSVGGAVGGSFDRNAATSINRTRSAIVQRRR